MTTEPAGGTSQPASPVCYAGAASTVYNGMAESSEIAAVLDEQLQAERSIVRKLENLIPRIQDESLREQLADMRRAHVDNIRLTEELLVARNKT